MIIKCDDCHKEFEMKQESERVEKDIRRIYFVCPHCSKKYIAYYLNSKIEQKQDKIRKISSKLNSCISKLAKADNLKNEFETLKKEIKYDMQKLKEQYGA
jgi:DNA-directed RNA polymerase subunit RPC12/RpoP